MAAYIPTYAQSVWSREHEIQEEEHVFLCFQRAIDGNKAEVIEGSAGPVKHSFQTPQLSTACFIILGCLGRRLMVRYLSYHHPSLLPTSGDTATPEAFWHTRQHRGARRALRGLGRLGPLRRLRPLGGLRRLKQRISGEIRDPWQCIFWHFEVGTCRKRDQDPQGVVQSPL